MANTLSVMTNVLRNVVSKQRIRYKEGGYNLDLAYICDNIIAMGYPADKIESIYRNRLDDVYKFLEDYHHDHYKIYNLCLERSYDINKFHKRVAVFPFEDHNPPTIELIQRFCNDVDSWLKKDRNNVAAVHCKAGKGRTGTMICCYLLYSGQQSAAEDALAFYDEKRTKNKKGVTIPSQRRYVQYFSMLVRSGLPYKPLTLKLCEIRFGEASHLQNQGIVNCSISCLQDSSNSIKSLYTMSIDFRKTSTLDISHSGLLISGDIRVEISHKTSRKSFFHFWFNTYFVYDAGHTDNNDSELIYTLHKWEIDDVHKDKEHKFFSEDFKVLLVFSKENLDAVMNNPIESSNSKSCNNVEKYKLSANEYNGEEITNTSPDICSGLCVSTEKNKSEHHEVERNKKLFSSTCKPFCVKTESASNIKITETCKASHPNESIEHNCLKHNYENYHTEKPILNTSANHLNTDGHGYHVNELSQKIEKTTICDENKFSKNSNMPQLPFIRNNSNISSVCSNNSISCGDENFEEEWESGESSAKHLQHNVLLSSSVNFTYSNSVSKKDHISYSFNLSNSRDNKLDGVNDNISTEQQIDFTTLNKTSCNAKSKYSKQSLNAVTHDSSSKHSLNAVSSEDFTLFQTEKLKNELQPLDLSGFFFSKKGRQQVQNKYFKHKNFSTIHNEMPKLLQPRQSTLSVGLKYKSMIISAKQKHKTKLKSKNKNKKFKKLQKLKNYLVTDEVDISQTLNHQPNYIPKCSIESDEKTIATKCSMITNSNSNYLTTNKPSFNVDSLNLSDDIYSSICDNQLSFSSSPCKTSRTFEDTSFNCFGIGHFYSQTKDTNLKSSSIVIAAKPAQTVAVGFKITKNMNKNENKYTNDVNNIDLNEFKYPTDVFNTNEDFIIKKREKSLTK